jgi:iron complex transport system permease protein
LTSASEIAGASAHSARVAGRLIGRRASLVSLALALVVALIAAIGIGAVQVSPAQVLRILSTAAGMADATEFSPEQAAVVTTIRLPRVLLAALVGAALGLGGAVLQGLFRNPLADPTLIGVSGGAAVATAFTIVLGASVVPGLATALGGAMLPIAAFAGALAMTAIVFRAGDVDGRSSLATILLAGIALNALASAGIGLMAFLASDEQLRNLTFWTLGSLGGASGSMLAIVAPLIVVGIAAMLALAAPLNALALGEAGAAHLGFDVQSVKRIGVAGCALAVGASVAVSGMIGFVGLVAPHLVRLAAGPDHRAVLPGAALLGATLLVVADLAARTLVVPAELPIGILTAVGGAPFFIALLVRQRRTLGF